MKSFITGSREYGKPTTDSDVDLVIYVDYVTKERLIALSDTGKMPCKFGSLNLIFATSQEEYAAWLLGKKLGNDQKPITDKKVAFEIHERARQLFGATYDHDSGEDK